MSKTIRFFKLLALALLIVFGPSVSYANEWYFSWGYQRDFWAPGDIHISQPDLGNDFTVHHVRAIDYPQWNEAISSDFTVPQFNLRYGRFLNSQHDLAIEFSIDHSKYTSAPNQTARISGMVNGQPVDRDEVLSPSFFNYRLHNGANHVMVNLVKRLPLIGPVNQALSLSLLVKGGLGIMLPHAESTIMGNNSDVGPKSWGNLVGTNSGWWRLNGWTTAAEVAVRFVPVRPVFIEISNKLAYAHLSNVPVFRGKADQSLWMNALMFNIGVTVNGNSTSENTTSVGP